MIIFARKRERSFGAFFFARKREKKKLGVFFWGIFCVLGVFVFVFRALARRILGLFFAMSQAKPGISALRTKKSYDGNTGLLPEVSGRTPGEPFNSGLAHSFRTPNALLSNSSRTPVALLSHHVAHSWLSRCGPPSDETELHAGFCSSPNPPEAGQKKRRPGVFHGRVCACNTRIMQTIPRGGAKWPGHLPFIIGLPSGWLSCAAVMHMQRPRVLSRALSPHASACLNTPMP